MSDFKSSGQLHLYEYKVIKLRHFFINSRHISDGMPGFDDEMTK